MNTVAVPHIADMVGDGLALADHSKADVRLCICEWGEEVSGDVHDQNTCMTAMI